MLLRSQWFLFYQTFPQMLDLWWNWKRKWNYPHICELSRRNRAWTWLCVFSTSAKPNNKEDSCCWSPRNTSRQHIFPSPEEPVCNSSPRRRKNALWPRCSHIFSQEGAGKNKTGRSKEKCRRRNDLCSSTAGIIKSPHVHNVPGRRGVATWIR